MALKFYNSLSRKIEVFKPLDKHEVRMYHCGPTVYNYAHIGNLRSYVFADILRRAVELQGFSVKQVINITDIGHLTNDSDDGDDKMVNALKRENKPHTMEAMKEIAIFYKEAFVSDLKSLRIELPHKLPFASEHVEQDIDIIEKITDNGFAYKASDGVYFNTKKYQEEYGDYGQLAGGINNLNWDEEFARVIPTKGKKDHKDFALWKFSKDSKIGFKSPWGIGFPGWHIECSAMAKEYLGQPFDIHTGGIDHIPIHHTNEIAQSKAAYGTQLANYWMHNGFVNVDGEKISKSLSNDIYLNDVKKIARPESYRLWLLMAHYRSPINFTYDALRASDTALTTLYEAFVLLPIANVSVSESYKKLFTEIIEDDINTPKAVALLFAVFKDEELEASIKRATILFFDKVLGLGFADLPVVEIPNHIKLLAVERDKVRENKDFKKADELRLQIEEGGFIVRDNKEGSQIVPARLSPNAVTTND